MIRVLILIVIFMSSLSHADTEEERLREQAEQAYRSQAYKDACALYTQAQLKSTEPLSYIKIRARLKELSQEKFMALRLWYQAHWVNPDDTDVWYGLLRTSLAVGDYEQSQKWLEKLQYKKPDEPSWYWWQARIYEVQGETEKAMRSKLSGSVAFPNHELYRSITLAQFPDERLEGWLTEPDLSETARKILIQRAIKKNDFEKAVRLSKESDAPIWQAWPLTYQKKWDEAERILWGSAIPESECLVRLGMIAYHQGDYIQAQSILQPLWVAARIDKPQLEALLYAGLTEFRLKNFKKARELWNIGHQLYPEEDSFIANLDIVKSYLGTASSDESVDVIEQEPGI